MARRNAEVAADVGEDGTDPLATDHGSDLVWGGQGGCVGGLLRPGAPR
jgi:hypothetical protein